MKGEKLEALYLLETKERLQRKKRNSAVCVLKGKARLPGSWDLFSKVKELTVKLQVTMCAILS